MNNLDAVSNDLESLNLPGWAKEYLQVLECIVGDYELILSNSNDDFLAFDVVRGGQVAQVLLRNLDFNDSAEDKTSNRVLAFIFLKYYEDQGLLDRCSDSWGVDALGTDFADLNIFDIHKPYPLEGLQQYLSCFKAVNLESSKLLFNDLAGVMDRQALDVVLKLEEVQALHKRRILSMITISNLTSYLFIEFLVSEYTSDFSMQLVCFLGFSTVFTLLLNHIDHVYYELKADENLAELDAEDLKKQQGANPDL